MTKFFSKINDTVIGVITYTPNPPAVVGNGSDSHPTRFFKTHPNSYYTFYSALVIILIVTGCLIFVGFLMKRNASIQALRHQLMPVYANGEGEDWEVELMEEGADQNLRRGYRSMDFPTTENTDLFRR